MEHRKELETLATFVHGGLFIGHCLGVAWNLKRGNPKSTLFHLGASLFDLFSTFIHLKESRKE